MDNYITPSSLDEGQSNVQHNMHMAMDKSSLCINL